MSRHPTDSGVWGCGGVGAQCLHHFDSYRWAGPTSRPRGPVPTQSTQPIQAHITGSRVLCCSGHSGTLAGPPTCTVTSVPRGEILMINVHHSTSLQLQCARLPPKAEKGMAGPQIKATINPSRLHGSGSSVFKNTQNSHFHPHGQWPCQHPLLPLYPSLSHLLMK